MKRTISALIMAVMTVAFLQGCAGPELNKSNNELLVDTEKSFNRGYYETAIAQWKKVKESYPADVLAKIRDCRDKQLQYEIYVANFYLKNEKYPAAIARLEKANKDFSDAPRPTEALLYLERATKLSGLEYKGEIGKEYKEEKPREIIGKNEQGLKADERKNSYELFLSTGYKIENFDWSIASSSVNVLSELSWRNLNIFQLAAGGKAVIEGVLPIPIYARGSLGYGWIVSGKNQDSDYNGNNRLQEWSRSNNNSSGDNEYAASLGIGSQATFFDSTFKVAPLVGYSYRKLNLRMTDGNQTIPASGVFAGLNSTYGARWHGPWAGVDLSFLSYKSFTFRSTLECHYVFYEGEGNWNLRSDLAHPKSMEQTATGYGLVSSLGADYNISRNWIISADLGYQYWTTGDGTDKRFFSDGTTYSGKFNGANSISLSTALRLNYRF